MDKDILIPVVLLVLFVTNIFSRRNNIVKYPDVQFIKSLEYVMIAFSFTQLTIIIFTFGGIFDDSSGIRVYVGFFEIVLLLTFVILRRVEANRILKSTFYSQ